MHNLHHVGRLDTDSEGMLILTNADSYFLARLKTKKGAMWVSTFITYHVSIQGHENWHLQTHPSLKSNCSKGQIWLFSCDLHIHAAAKPRINFTS
jgi:hypothetical protein